MKEPPPAGVTTVVDGDTVSATAIVDATAADVFDFLRRPENHAKLSGDGSVRSSMAGPELLGLDDRFGMQMHVVVPYRIKSRVLEFEQDRRIAWAHFAGHRWRWELEPLTGEQTRVTETFDQSTARFPPALRAIGYPGRHESNVARSVANLAAHFVAPGAAATDP